jgi:hypothetical protein
MKESLSFPFSVYIQYIDAENENGSTGKSHGLMFSV